MIYMMKPDGWRVVGAQLVQIKKPRKIPVHLSFEEVALVASALLHVCAAIDDDAVFNEEIGGSRHEVREC
jgi:hypothetical protein